LQRRLILEHLRQQLIDAQREGIGIGKRCAFGQYSKDAFTRPRAA
jgi:hypothetical protein